MVCRLWRQGLAWLLLLLISGCAASSVRRDYFLDRLDASELARVEAYQITNDVVIRIPRPGRDTYVRGEFTGEWEQNEGYGYGVAELVADDTARELFRAARRLDGAALHLLGPEDWQRLLERMMERLVPEVPGEGVLLLVQNHEIVVYREKDLRIALAGLEAKPSGVNVVHTVNDGEFAREMVRLIESYLQAEVGADRRFLFATAVEPPFVAVDVERKSTLFLSRGINPEIRGSEPVAFSFRAIDVLLIRSHLFMLLKNPCTVLFRGLAQIGDTGMALLSAGRPVPSEALPPVGDGVGMDLEQWEADLDKQVSAPRYRGEIQFLIDGEAFFPELIQSIQTAQERIDFRLFIFDNDDYAVKVAELLRERSEEVRVKVMMDALGSLFASANLPQSPMPLDFQPPEDIAEYLRRGSRVHVRRATNPWLTADHVKTLIFDEKEAYLGGMNIGREYRYDWHDMMVRLKGPIVGRLVRDFKRAWAHAGWAGDLAYWWATMVTHDRGRGKPGGANAIDLRPLYTKTHKREIYWTQMEAIRRAQRYIYIQNSYISDNTILRALMEARASGVDVRVVLPSKNDDGIMSKSNLVTANAMIRAGIRVYAYPGMSHVKAAIYDGWACLGSANFDKLSLRTNQEIDVAFSDPETVERLKVELFEADFARSKELLEPVRVDWTDYLIEVLADQL